MTAPTNIVLSNVGATRVLAADAVDGAPFDTIAGQFLWIVSGIPGDASMYFERLFVEQASGRFWVPLYEFPAIDQIDKNGSLSGHQQLEISTGTYRVTATDAGGFSYVSRMGTPFP